MDSGDPRDAIERLEARIEQLESKIEGCRKLILASKIAVTGGGIVFVALVFGAIRFDPAWMAGAAAALIGGFVLWGSNVGTTRESEAEIAEAEARRAALIGQIDLRVVPDGKTLH
jgi:hypothetical protein